MHLSNEIQKHLDDLNSSVKLASTIDGFFPDKYSFIHQGTRQFRTEFASNDQEFSIVLFEWKPEYKYEHCFARGLFKDTKRLANTIDLWVDKQKTIFEIAKSFTELELFSDFEIRNPNIDIDKAWTKVKNSFFNDTTFWKSLEWNERYLELLTKAKEHQAFQNLFPFTSHYWLRFSIDKFLNETWVLDVYIIASFDKSYKDFYVSYNDIPMGGKFFQSARDALNFYTEKLNEIAPIKWNTDKG